MLVREEFGAASGKMHGAGRKYIHAVGHAQLTRHLSYFVLGLQGGISQPMHRAGHRLSLSRGFVSLRHQSLVSCVCTLGWFWLKSKLTLAGCSLQLLQGHELYKERNKQKAKVGAVR